MSVNKVAVNGETIIDLTEDSVTPETLIKGTTAHNKAGEPITGSLEVDTREVWVCYPVPDLSQFSTAVTVTTPLFTFGAASYPGSFNRIKVTSTQIYHVNEANDLYPRYSVLHGWASSATRVLIFDEPVDETSEAYAVLSKIATKTVYEALGIIQVSKSLSVTENGTVEIVPDSGFDMLLKATVEVNVDAPTPVLQEKTIAPTTSEQVVTPDDGYDGLSSVTVEGMNEAEQATPVITVSSTGLITAKSTQTAGYVSDGTKSATKRLTTQSAKTVTPSTSSQTAVASGRYTTGNVMVSAVPTETKTVELSMKSGNQTISRSTNKFMTSVVVKKPSTLVPENIKKDIVIGGVTGTLEASSSDGETETWVLRKSLLGTENLPETDIKFISNGVQYSTIKFVLSISNGGIFYDNTRIFNFDMGTWESDVYRKVTFLETPPSSLLEWLSANGTEVEVWVLRADAIPTTVFSYTNELFESNGETFTSIKSGMAVPLGVGLMGYTIKYDNTEASSSVGGFSDARRNYQKLIFLKRPSAELRTWLETYGIKGEVAVETTKSVEITTNGTVTIKPDTPYEAMHEVSVTTNIIGTISGINCESCDLPQFIVQGVKIIDSTFSNNTIAFYNTTEAVFENCAFTNCNITCTTAIRTAIENGTNNIVQNCNWFTTGENDVE